MSELITLIQQGITSLKLIYFTLLFYFLDIVKSAFVTFT